MVFLDSNTIIYLSKEVVNVEDIFESDKEYAISVITYMEVLGFNFKSKDELDFTKSLISYLDIIYIDEVISHKVIELRKKYRIKLPDAIICASAIINNSVLITNDIRLKNIKELNIKSLRINE